MKELVIFYSYGGATRKAAQALATQRGADLAEVSYPKKPSIVGAFFQCPAAAKQAPAKKLNPIATDFSAYEKVTVMGPIWANNPAPPVNNILEALPAGKTVELRFCSGGGKSDKEAVLAKAKQLGLHVADYVDITSGTADS